jgi:hypothetical protein
MYQAIAALPHFEPKTQDDTLAPLVLDKLSGYFVTKR